MKQFIFRLFHIYPGEGKRVLLFTLLAYFYAFAVTCGNKFAESLFLLNVGPDFLPISYIYTAVALLIASIILLKSLGRFSPHQIFVGVMSLAALSYSTLFIFLMTGLAEGSTLFWFAMKVNGYLCLMVILSCFWVFVDEYFHLQDAKRFFCLFNSAVFIGAATTGTVMHFAAFTLPQLLLLILSLIGITISVSFVIVHSVPVVQEEEVAGEKECSLWELGRAILSSRFVVLLMMCSMLTLLLSMITEYNYMVTFTERFMGADAFIGSKGTEAELTQFIGECFASVSILNLILGLFVYSRLVRRFGVYNMVICTPIMLVIAFSGWLTTDLLLFPLIGFFVVEGSLYVVEDSNLSLLLNGVPKKIRRQSRVIMEVFFEPIGILLSGLILEFVVFDSQLVGLVLSLSALILALFLRKEFIPSIYRNLREATLHCGSGIEEWVEVRDEREREQLISRCFSTIRMGKGKERLMAVEFLLAVKEGPIFQALLSCGDKDSDLEKREFLKLVKRAGWEEEASFQEQLKIWEEKCLNPALKGDIHFLMASAKELTKEKALLNIEAEDPTLRGASLLALQASVSPLLYNSTEEEVLAGLRVVFRTKEIHYLDRVIQLMNHSSYQVALRASEACVEMICSAATHRFQELLQILMSSVHSKVRLCCLEAIEKLISVEQVPTLLRASLRFRPRELRKLEKMCIGMQPEVVPFLTSYLQDLNEPASCRVTAGKILGQVAMQGLLVQLPQVIEKEIEQAYVAFFHSYQFKKNLSEAAHNYLVSFLRHSFDSSIHFVVQLLSVAGAIEDPELMIRGLKSRSLKQRGRVLEMLEKHTDRRLFRLLAPLIGEIPVQEKLRAFHLGGRKEMDLPSLLNWMSVSSTAGEKVASEIRRKAGLQEIGTAPKQIYCPLGYQLLEGASA